MAAKGKECEDWKAKTFYLSSLGVGDAGVTKVTVLPFGVEAVALQLPELKGRVEGASMHLNGDGVYSDGHALHHFLGKAVLTVSTRGLGISREPAVFVRRGFLRGSPLACCYGDGRRAIGWTRLFASSHLNLHLIQELHNGKHIKASLSAHNGAKRA